MQVFSSTSAPVASALKKECRSYEALPDAPGDVDQPTSPGAVPSPLLPCKSSLRGASGQQQVGTFLLSCGKHGDPQEKLFGTKAGYMQG